MNDLLNVFYFIKIIIKSSGTTIFILSPVTAIKSVDILQTTSIAVDFIPVVGNVKSGFEAVFGFDPITLNKLSEVERGIAVVGILGGPIVKGIKHGSKMVTAVTSNVTDSLNNPAVVKTFDKLKDSIENMKSNMTLKTDNDFAFATAGSGKDKSTTQATTTKSNQQTKDTDEVSNSNEELSRIEYLHNKYGQFTTQELNHRINLRGAVEKEL